MLILTRKVGESIIIEDNIELKILDIGVSTTKIGIVAPKNIGVFRKELIDELVSENKEALSKNVSPNKILEVLKGKNR
jgi:carbon storage regulator